MGARHEGEVKRRASLTLRIRRRLVIDETDIAVPDQFYQPPDLEPLLLGQSRILGHCVNQLGTFRPRDDAVGDDAVDDLPDLHDLGLPVELTKDTRLADLSQEGSQSLC